MTAAPVLHLRRLGQLTAGVRRPCAGLARAVEALGIDPAVTIDGVPYFDGAAAGQVTGISLSSNRRSLSELTVAAEDVIKPRFLRVPGVARVDLAGLSHATVPRGCSAFRKGWPRCQ